MAEFPLDRLISIAVAHANEELHALALTCALRGCFRCRRLKIHFEDVPPAGYRMRTIARGRQSSLSMSTERRGSWFDCWSSSNGFRICRSSEKRTYVALRCSLPVRVGFDSVLAAHASLVLLLAFTQEGMMLLIAQNDAYRRAADRLGEVNKMIEQQVCSVRAETMRHTGHPEPFFAGACAGVRFSDCSRSVDDGHLRWPAFAAEDGSAPRARFEGAEAQHALSACRSRSRTGPSLSCRGLAPRFVRKGRLNVPNTA